MSERIIERRGNQVYVVWEDDWTGEDRGEWRHDPIRMCACGQRTEGSCNEVKVTTFSETYSCGFVYRYNNSNGYEDRLISVKGKRIK